MFAKNLKSLKGEELPQDYLNHLAAILNETYENECHKFSSSFDAFGYLYPEELLVIVSLVSTKDPHRLPITCFLSCEKKHMETPQKIKQTQKDYLDIFGLLFDEIFSNQDWSDYEPVWQEVDYKNETYFFKISRENIALTLEANKLLGDEFTEEN